MLQLSISISISIYSFIKARNKTEHITVEQDTQGTLVLWQWPTQ